MNKTKIIILCIILTALAAGAFMFTHKHDEDGCWRYPVIFTYKLDTSNEGLHAYSKDNMTYVVQQYTKNEYEQELADCREAGFEEVKIPLKDRSDISIDYAGIGDFDDGALSLFVLFKSGNRCGLFVEDISESKPSNRKEDTASLIETAAKVLNSTKVKEK